MTRAQLIVSIAKQYIGQKEISGNKGFKDAVFQKLMVAAGWLIGQAWCAYFVKAIYKQAYANNAELLKTVNQLCNGGALATYNNHAGHKVFKVSQTPAIGAIVIWAHGKGPQGHAGIVIGINGNTITTVEGNTNGDGSREGDCVAQKLRTVTRDFKAAGLNIKGFIHPVED